VVINLVVGRFGLNKTRLTQAGSQHSGLTRVTDLFATESLTFFGSNYYCLFLCHAPLFAGPFSIFSRLAFTSLTQETAMENVSHPADSNNPLLLA
jgi:hypothetical protein